MNNSKKTRMLGIYRATEQRTGLRRVFCSWLNPFIVVEVDRLGKMYIARWAVGPDEMRVPPFQWGIYQTEDEAVAAAEKRADYTGNWHLVLDLRGLGPEEVPASVGK